MKGVWAQDYHGIQLHPSLNSLVQLSLSGFGTKMRVCIRAGGVSQRCLVCLDDPGNVVDGECNVVDGESTHWSLQVIPLF